MIQVYLADDATILTIHWIFALTLTRHRIFIDEECILFIRTDGTAIANEIYPKLVLIIIPLDSYPTMHTLRNLSTFRSPTAWTFVGTTKVDAVIQTPPGSTEFFIDPEYRGNSSMNRPLNEAFFRPGTVFEGPTRFCVKAYPDVPSGITAQYRSVPTADAFPKCRLRDAGNFTYKPMIGVTLGPPASNLYDSAVLEPWRFLNLIGRNLKRSTSDQLRQVEGDSDSPVIVGSCRYYLSNPAELRGGNVETHTKEAKIVEMILRSIPSTHRVCNMLLS